tara:strand:+ start:106 stop:282 length:177 start_codon:yes stop_codon:yes gene_type:complete
MQKQDYIDKLRGKWVVILDERIIFSGEDIKKIINQAKEKYPDKKLVLAKVPEEGTLIY